MPAPGATKARKSNNVAAATSPFSHTSIGERGVITIKPGQMYGTVEVITADQARRILEEAEHGTDTLRQRQLKRNVLAEFAGVIDRGEWKPVPPGLVYDTKNRLINGRHRLTAQEAKGVTLPWFVIRNCDPEIFALIDTHSKRSVADALFMALVVDKAAGGQHMGSALRLMVSFEAALRNSDTGLTGWTGWNRETPTNPQLFKTLEGHAGIGESLTVGYRVHGATRTKSTTGRGYSSPGFNIAAVTAWHRLVSDIHDGQEEELEKFADMIAYGRMLDKGDPAYTLRRWLARGMPVAHHDGGSTHRITREAVFFALTTAWNAYAKHKTMEQLMVSVRQPMPLPEARRPKRVNAGSGRG